MKLIDGLPLKPWETLTECPHEELRNPERVHVDVFGNVQVCQGLSIGNVWRTRLSDLIRKYDADAHPVCGPLLKGGPAQLAREHSLPHEAAYVDPCHFCTSMCQSLIERYPEYLGPRHIYGLS